MLNLSINHATSEDVRKPQDYVFKNAKEIADLRFFALPELGKSI